MNATNTVKPTPVIPVILKNWKISAVKGGGVCVKHAGGQTSNLKQLQVGGLVMTENKTVYLLKPEEMHPGMWAMGLSMRRPSEFANLQKYGIL